MRNKLFVILLALTVAVLCGCEESYTKSDVEEERQQAYNEGYKAGYYRGTNDQQEEDYDNLLLDGLSIKGLAEQVYNMYGITPHEAFTIVEDYEYDSSQGGYTWDEYQNAIDAIYYTACIFPQE